MKAKEMILKARHEIEKEEIKKHSAQIESFVEVCKNSGIDISNSVCEYYETIGVFVQIAGLCNKLIETLVFDKEWLVNLAFLNASFGRDERNPGYFRTRNYMFMASRFLRRRCGEYNEFNNHLLNCLNKIDTELNEVKISVDEDRIKISNDAIFCFKKDFWFGPKFTPIIENVKDGIAQLQVPCELDYMDIDLLFCNALALDVKWNTKNGIKTCQIEEVNQDRAKIIYNGIEYIPSRYLHAEYSLASKVFRHVDGAIHLYTREEYKVRKGSDYNHNNKSNIQIKPLSKKIFKVNGSVSIDKWKELVSSHFVGNYLIIEYFDGAYPDDVIEMINRMKQEKRAV